MHLQIIRVGKIREPYIQEAEKHYLKLLPRLEVLTIKGTDTAKADTQLIVQKLTNSKNIYILAEKGKEYNSLQFAQLMNPYLSLGQHATLVFAGPFGWDYSLLPKSWHLLSLSLLTFPHELAYIILLEQLFRASKIGRGQKYHY